MPPELHEQAEAKFRLLHELVEVCYISCETMRSEPIFNASPDLPSGVAPATWTCESSE
jgi:hypothetical protein